MDFSIVHSLNKLFIAAGLCYLYRSLTFAQGLGFRCAQDSDQLSEYNRTRCTDESTCYSKPPSEGLGYEVKYAIYRSNGANYIQVSNLTFNFTLGQGESDNGRWICDEPHNSEAGQFNCCIAHLSTSFPIQTGDVICVCVYNESIMSCQMDAALSAAKIEHHKLKSHSLGHRICIRANIMTSK